MESSGLHYPTQIDGVEIYKFHGFTTEVSLTHAAGPSPSISGTDNNMPKFPPPHAGNFQFVH
jgi:hypothetical protein